MHTASEKDQSRSYSRALAKTSVQIAGPVDIDDAGSHGHRRICSEPGHELADLLHMRHAAQRVLREDGGAVGAVEHLACHVCFYPSRRHCEHQHILGRQVLRHALAERVERGLGRCVCWSCQLAAFGSSACDVDDATATRLSLKCSAAKEAEIGWAQEVDVHCLLHSVLKRGEVQSRRLKIVGDAHTSVVDQNIDAAPRLQNNRDQSLALAGRSHLGLVNGESTSLHESELPRDGVHRRFIAVVVKRQVEAGGGELEGNARADAPAGPSDQGDWSVLGRRAAHNKKSNATQSPVRAPTVLKCTLFNLIRRSSGRSNRLPLTADR